MLQDTDLPIYHYERIIYDAYKCDQACINLPSKDCVQFISGREDGSKVGQCHLLKSQCTTLQKSLEFDLFSVSTLSKPSTTELQCTHQQPFSALAPIRDKCSAITDP